MGSVIRLRSFACMHACNIECSDKMLMDFDPSRHFDCKKMLFRKKDNKNIAYGHECHERTSRCLVITHILAHTDIETCMRSPSDRHESQFTWLKSQNDQFDMFDTRVRVSKCNANEKLVFSPLCESKSAFLMSKESSKSKKKEETIVVSIYRTSLLRHSLLFSSPHSFDSFSLLALSVHFFCLFCRNRFIIISLEHKRLRTRTHDCNHFAF